MEEVIASLVSTLQWGAALEEEEQARQREALVRKMLELGLSEAQVREMIKDGMTYEEVMRNPGLCWTCSKRIPCKVHPDHLKLAFVEVASNSSSIASSELSLKGCHT